MAGERLSPTRSHARISVAVVTAAACVATGLTVAGAGTAAPGLAQRPAPPTAAEVARWQAEFMRSEGSARKVAPAAAPRAPGAGLFPGKRVLSLYGAAGGFGVIGRKSVRGAGKKLKKQIEPYRKRSNKPVVPAFDLVAVIATQCGGRRDKCRVRVSDSIIERYLQKIRNLNGRLILDIQPGRADVLDEIRHLRPFLRESNVDVAIDAEWNVGRNEEPGQDAGTIQAERINKAIGAIRRIQERQGLPPKLLVIHQFKRSSVKHRGDIHRPSNLDVTINFDGIGSPSAKRAGYAQIHSGRQYNGFSLFYKLDQNLMSPSAVLGLDPKPSYVMYQ